MVNGYCTITRNKEIKFGILPLGTGNDFARSLNINKSVKELKQLILNDSYIAVDLFKMSFIDVNNKKNIRFFNKPF